MSTQPLDAPAQLGLPVGTWRPDVHRSRLGFEVKTMWGLVTVKGRFLRFDGSLSVTPEGASVELTADATSLDTANARRDEHLRSADFFDVARRPAVSFLASEVTPTADGGLTVTGDLRVASSTIRLQLPVEVERRDGGRLRLRTTTSVTRTQAGMEWNKLAMIRGDARLLIDVELEPEDGATGS